MKQVFGMGAALVDVLAFVSDEWIKDQGVEKGGMNMVDASSMQQFLARVEEPVKVPGGSAANTIVGLSKLGGNASFFSKVGPDELGNLFREHLKNAGVQDKMLTIDAATGCVFSAITPDAERSMWTYLGASDLVAQEDFTAELFEGAHLLYAEGYTAFNAPRFKHAFELAKKLGLETALDFSSFDVVHACRKTFDELFENKMIDIIIANEDEAYAYAGVKEEDALQVLAEKAKIAIVKLGKRGSLIAHEGIVYRIPGKVVNAIDTTGAGDLWAAGFLFGYLSEKSLEDAGKIGSIVAAEVVQVMGAQMDENTWARIQKEIAG